MYLCIVTCARLSELCNIYLYKITRIRCNMYLCIVTCARLSELCNIYLYKITRIH
jgi:hypothetical protein